MTETKHARSRRASVVGLAVQVLATAGTLAIWVGTHSLAVLHLAWFLAAGIPCWFIALLVFRQHELAELESLDLEELQREKQATGGGEALFGEEGGVSVGFRVAQRRLEWMRSWLVPAFSLVVAGILAGVGVSRFLAVRALSRQAETNPDLWPPILGIELGLVVLALITLVLFFISRYASGLGHIAEWRLLRACGSFTFGNTLASAAVVICFAIKIYRGGSSDQAEHIVAWAIPILMVVLAVEAFFNFILDIYRPRSPGSEARAAFDSRLLGLVSEPGGIAHSLAEAMNYQFGFQVSQTWFYQLLQRAAIPLIWVGVAALWLLSCVIVVEPFERVIVERFGRPTNLDDPLTPGLHLKMPWPIDAIQRFNVDQLHSFAVGYKAGDQPKDDPREWVKGPPIELWTDARHSGQEHFNFLIPPLPFDREGAKTPSATRPAGGDAASVPVNLLRMEIFVQYKLRPTAVGQFAKAAADASVRGQDPHRAVRQIAWDESRRMASSTAADVLLGGGRERIGELLRTRVAARLDELGMGLEVVWIGITNAHPEKTVAEAYRKLITSQQERVKEIRNARVEEDRVLAQVAGDPQRAVRLSDAIERLLETEVAQSRVALPPNAAIPAAVSSEVDALVEPLSTRLNADWAQTQLARAHERMRDEFDLGMGHTLRDLDESQKRLDQARAQLAATDAAYRASADAVGKKLRDSIGQEAGQAVIDDAQAKITSNFWRATLESNLIGLEGDAAVRLAQAQAARWIKEAVAEAQVKRLQNEREAFAASPKVYKARQYLKVMAAGLANARKYFMAFDPGDRKLHIRFDLQESVADLSTMSTVEKK